MTGPAGKLSRQPQETGARPSTSRRRDPGARPQDGPPVDRRRGPRHPHGARRDQDRRDRRPAQTGHVARRVQNRHGDRRGRRQEAEHLVEGAGAVGVDHRVGQGVGDDQRESVPAGSPSFTSDCLLTRASRPRRTRCSRTRSRARGTPPPVITIPGAAPCTRLDPTAAPRPRKVATIRAAWVRARTPMPTTFPTRQLDRAERIEHHLRRSGSTSPRRRPSRSASRTALISIHTSTTVNSPVSRRGQAGRRRASGRGRAG